MIQDFFKESGLAAKLDAHLCFIWSPNVKLNIRRVRPHAFFLQPVLTQLHFKRNGAIWELITVRQGHYDIAGQY